MTELRIGFWHQMNKTKNSKKHYYYANFVYFKNIITKNIFQIFRTPRPPPWCGSVNGWTIRTSTDLVTPFVMKVLELSSMIWPNSCYSAMEGKLNFFKSWYFHVVVFYKVLLKIWKRSWEPFRSCLLNSTANPVHFHQNWAELAVLFSRQILNGS